MIVAHNGIEKMKENEERIFLNNKGHGVFMGWAWDGKLLFLSHFFFRVKPIQVTQKSSHDLSLGRLGVTSL